MSSRWVEDRRRELVPHDNSLLCPLPLTTRSVFYTCGRKTDKSSNAWRAFPTLIRSIPCTGGPLHLCGSSSTQCSLFVIACLTWQPPSPARCSRMLCTVCPDIKMHLILFTTCRPASAGVGAPRHQHQFSSHMCQSLQDFLVHMQLIIVE